MKVVAPFLFVYAPELLMIGTPTGIALATIAAFAGTFAAGTALTGWMMVPLRAAHRAGFAVVAILATVSLVFPVGGGPSLMALAAALALLAVVVFQLWSIHENRPADLAS